MNSKLTHAIVRGAKALANEKNMYKQSCTKLLEEPAHKIALWLNSFDSIITDCDGVLWIYGKALSGSADVINFFTAEGKSVYFCTNNSTKTRQELYKKGKSMGFQVNADSIISTAHSTAQYLKARNFNKRVYVIGSEGITQELAAVGIPYEPIGPDPMQGTLVDFTSQHLKLSKEIGAVVVGFDEHFSFPKMTKAASYLSDTSCLFIATNTDERFPMPDIVIPGSGSIVRAVQTCSEREPFVIGKPNPAICEHLIKQKIINPSRTLMIGDRCNTDILLGYNCGFQTLLVGTGIHQLNDVEDWRKSKDPEVKKLIPDVFLPKLGDLLPLMIDAKTGGAY